MDDLKSKKILEEYKKKSDAIIDSMLSILVRASRKADNIHYQRILDQVNKELAAK